MRKALMAAVGSLLMSSAAMADICTDHGYPMGTQGYLECPARCIRQPDPLAKTAPGYGVGSASSELILPLQVRPGAMLPTSRSAELPDVVRHGSLHHRRDLAVRSQSKATKRQKRRVPLSPLDSGNEFPVYPVTLGDNRLGALGLLTYAPEIAAKDAAQLRNVSLRRRCAH